MLACCIVEGARTLSTPLLLLLVVTIMDSGGTAAHDAQMRFWRHNDSRAGGGERRRIQRFKPVRKTRRPARRTQEDLRCCMIMDVSLS